MEENKTKSKKGILKQAIKSAAGDRFSKISKLFVRLGFTKKFCLFLAFILAFTAGAFASLIAYKHFFPTTSYKLDQINALVRNNYLGEIDDKALEDALASAYIDGIDDKYGFYQNAEGGTLVEQSLEGTASGIGVTIVADANNKSLNVFRVDANSPADKAGIKIGDKITAIDNKSVEKMGFEESVKAIKREIGEKAKITLLRGNKTLNLTVIYEDFVRQSVYYEITSGYGYVTITDFNANTVPQFKKAYEDLNKQNVKGFIFDVRDNGGGTVDSVCEILDILVGKCDLITIAYADGSKTVNDNAISDENKCDLPMAVLINENTASASELFAANLRDMAKVPLIGKNTFGKGVVQRTYFFDDGSCIRFTVGEFLPAGGKGFDGEGLAPDFEITLTKEQAANKYTPNADDPCLNKAIEQLIKVK